MKCQSCSHEFCWLCLGGKEVHENSGFGHFQQCNRVADVERKGRSEIMEKADLNAKQQEIENKRKRYYTRKYIKH